MRVSIRNLAKRFGESLVLNNITLDIQDRELFFLLGPSGCGKTTLLRTIAGFYQPDEGELRFGGQPMNLVPPHKRNTGMVFQNYALWPHMSVAENVAYGLGVRRVSALESKQRVAEALAIVRMDDYADRTPNQLSGGQQQRVALARALVIKPDVLLLDEPLSNLDARLRLEMRDEIRRIHADTKITTIYVTHDQKESLSLADRIAVMREGRVEQIGDPRTIYRSPVNRFVADFIGETNWLTGEVTALIGSEFTLKTGVGDLQVSTGNGLKPGQTVLIGFRPEAVEIGESRSNPLHTIIHHVTYLGDVQQYELGLPGGMTIKAIEQNPREIRPVGASLDVHVRPQNLIVLPEA